VPGANVLDWVFVVVVVVAAAAADGFFSGKVVGDIVGNNKSNVTSRNPPNKK
jgi:hypothetical protein